MRKFACDLYKEIAILGSFSKHYDLIVKIAHKFEENGFTVLVPKLEGVKKTNNSFLLLEGDKSNNPKELEKEYIKKCLEADLVYVCNQDGYIGKSVAFELGFLSAFKQEIFFLTKPEDELLNSLIPYSKGNVLNYDDLIKALELRNAIINAFYDDNLDPPFDKTFGLFDEPIPNNNTETTDNYIKYKIKEKMI